MLGHFALNLLDGDRTASLLLEDIAEQILDDLPGDFLRSLSQLKEATRMSAPSSRRTLLRMRSARNSITQGSRAILKLSAFFLRIAMRVSMLGGCNSAVMPHSKRETQPLLELLNLAGWTVAREHDLLVAVVQRVECMKTPPGNVPCPRENECDRSSGCPRACNFS